RVHGRLALRRSPHRARAVDHRGPRPPAGLHRPARIGVARDRLGAHASQGTGRSGRPRVDVQLRRGRMAVEIKVPALGESVTEATVSKWMVKAGDAVTVDQPLCELETDKVTVEVPATVAGTMVDLAVEEGATVQVGGVLCHIEAR